jgi:DNA-directed RNA polymerase subunit H (RpoH/RPB5)
MSLKDRIGSSYRTIVEMLEDRKALQPEELAYLQNFSDAELKILANKSTFNIDIGSKLRIMYHLGKFKIGDLRKLIDDTHFDKYILVLMEKLTTPNVKNVQKIAKDIEIFYLKETVFNITKHILVPHHEVITDEEEIAKIVEMYNVKNKHQFPLLLRTDPISRYYGIKPGNLVRITRVSPSAGDVVVYRCCV